MKKIMVIDDDRVFLRLTAKFLKKNGFEVETFEEWGPADRHLEDHEVDLVLVDLHLPDRSGIEIIQEIKQTTPELPILMITAHSSIQTAIEAVKAGAEDYIQKPCENSEILFKIHKTFENVHNKSELRNLKQTLEKQYSFQVLVTKDEDMKKVYQLAKTAADLDILIFISGETGTGKEVLAKTIHMSCNRNRKPFVVFNCAAINENLVESELFGHKKGSFTSAHADKKGLCETVEDGTLFIDEIGELSLGVQKKLLRLLQEKEFESIGSTKVQKFRGRLICASHCDLKKMIRAGNFREDLFFRLNVFPLHIKPLRERIVDLMDLSREFLDLYNAKYEKNVRGFTSKTVKMMMDYRWPGNIRELEHFIERQVLISKKSEIDIRDPGAFSGLDIREQPKSGAESPKEVDEFSAYMNRMEYDYLCMLMKACHGSIEKAAAMAGIHRKTLYVKLKDHNLNKKGFK
jgi:DNA-binding NtrC family response regulator